MPRGTKKVVEAPVEPETTPNPSEKETLLALYDELNRRGIRSISDLENQIAQAE